MSLSLAQLNTPVQWCVLRKGSRTFALLGKVTSGGLTSFCRNDLPGNWALTAEYGCLRMERLSGDEEVTWDQLFLPTSCSYDYGVSGVNQSLEMSRAIFGLLAHELEQLVDVLRRGSFPMLGFSAVDVKCSFTSCVIPAYWPHVVVSNLALYGNVVSVEAFVRILVSSLPQGQLGVRFPELQPVFKQMMKLMVIRRRGMPYSKEVLDLAPVPLAA
jgi:hypothetical protein